MVVTPASVVLAGRYRLEGCVAYGGVGEVWRATDLVLGRPVAVKLLRAEYAQHPEVLARFRAEARHAGSVSHPGIAQVYDYGEDGAAASPYLVMELVDGPSLARVLAAGPLTPAHAMDVLAQAAAGLQAAHAAGLVHRDIKPGNLLVGPSGQVKVTDFGIAHAAWSAPITQTGALVGTPAYLAPERVTGGPATPASDLYSLGLVGYQCLTGAVPFEGIAHEVTAAHQHRTLPPLPPAVPAGVAELVNDLAARDPAARPASAGEVAVRAGRLRDALAGRPTAPPPSAPVGPPPARARGAEPVTLVGDPVTLAGDPVPMPGDSVPMAGEPALPPGEPVPWTGGPVPWAGEPATLADMSGPGLTPTHRRLRREGMRPARKGMRPPGGRECRPRAEGDAAPRGRECGPRRRGCGRRGKGCGPRGACCWPWPVWRSWRAWRDGCWRAPSGPGRSSLSREAHSLPPARRVPPRAHRPSRAPARPPPRAPPASR